MKQHRRGGAASTSHESTTNKNDNTKASSRDSASSSTLKSKGHGQKKGSQSRRNKQEPKQRLQSSQESTFQKLLKQENAMAFASILVLILAIMIGGSAWMASKMGQGQDFPSPSTGGNSPSTSSSSSKNSTSNIHSRSNEMQQSAKKTEIPQKEKTQEREPIYTIPRSMPHIGDKSAEYAALRKVIDSELPYNPDRSIPAVKALHKYQNISTYSQDLNYDIYNCPDEPPPGYPYEWSTTKIIEAWNPDDMTVPQTIHQGLCVFDYQRDYIKALTYRNAEVPFVVSGDPDVAATVERWNSPTYLQELLGDSPSYRTEISESSDFMFWMLSQPKNSPSTPIKSNDNNHPTTTTSTPEGWKPPTRMVRMSYQQWLEHANITHPHNKEDDDDDNHAVWNPDSTHWYMRLISCGESASTSNCDASSSEWLYDELTFFQPQPDALYLTDPSKQNGIHCRFGMTGVKVANHLDLSRNAIVLLGGHRRYILSHPQNCIHMRLYPQGHPSARHSAVDWSHPDLQEFPEFAQAKSNEVVMQAGDVLYLPTCWFHYIVSLSLNYQCNTRSGMSFDHLRTIKDCGF